MYTTAENQLWWAVPHHSGPDYKEPLARLHATLSPKTYLEIGTLSGDTLALARCASIAIDPEFQIEKSAIGRKQASHFFQMTSDEFFINHDPTNILGRPIDMAFLDGMHLYEFLLRDFINVEKFCQRNSVVILHDCIPTDAFVARRSYGDKSLIDRTESPDWWAGDVWKTVAILRKYRPDLRIRAFDAPPTGLIAITNLDPRNDTLAKSYFNFVEEFQRANLAGSGYQDYVASIDLQSTSVLNTQESVASMFWL